MSPTGRPKGELRSVQHEGNSVSAALSPYGADDPAVQRGLVTPEQFSIAVRKQRALQEQGRSSQVYDLLVRDRFVSRERIDELLQRSPTGAGSGDRDAGLLPVALCQRLQVAPIAIEAGRLHVAAARPLSLAERASLITASGRPVQALQITPTDRVDIFRRVGRLAARLAQVPALLEDLRKQEITAALLRAVVEAILVEALRSRASDVHLDCCADPDSWISFRIDGLLQQRHQVPERIMRAVFVRLKNETGMDASASNRPQDGRLSLDDNGRRVDFRVASQPLAHGETMALRLLDPDALPSFDALFPATPRMARRLRSLSAVHGKTGGLLLFSGPTGSGKTTTLYAVSQSLPRDRINVVTVEDPVEFTLPFARQIQINQLLGQRTVDVERSILRQDPDVIVFGEIRDSDSATAALKFTESGHLVLATVHAASALQTFERFVSFFDEHAKRDALFILAHALRLLFNQRLAQKLCDCARPAAPEDADEIAATLHDTALVAPELERLRLRVGCPRCDHTGIFGRVLAYESIVIDADETARLRVAALLESSQGNVARIADLPGVQFEPRGTALNALLDAGLIDPVGARRVLGI